MDIIKTIRTLFIFILAINVIGCGNSSNSPDEESNTNITQLDQLSDVAIESYIAFDVLGGIFGRSSEIESMTLEPNYESEKSVGKLSINVPPPKNDNVSKTFNIDSGFTFVGKGGSGKLILSISGDGEEIDTDPKNIIRHFNSLHLRFLFLRYRFDNICLGEVHLHGEIVCDIEGNYDINKKSFSGKSHCRHKIGEQSKGLYYITQKKTYETGMDALIEINGDPFNFGSYKYSGQVVIDGSERKIEELNHNIDSCS